jgi:hypothetical protein
MVEKERLTPNHKWLSDPAVLVQAWKKSHAYIRRHNWYADSLELDVSTVELESLVQDLSHRLEVPRGIEFQPELLRLILAPKASNWTTPDQLKPKWDSASSWQPIGGADTMRLRPLAHLKLRDQVAATAVMMCLADCIETALGNPAASQNGASSQTVSYGNRLVCLWNEGRASFGWGNTKVYRQYYADYRQFLKQPLEFSNQTGSAPTAIIHLDLKGFYDNIDRNELISILKSEANRYYTQQDRTDEFWHIVQRILDWDWYRSDLKHLPEELKQYPKRGLPQGMVASGFFANAYMIPFDRRMLNFLKHQSHGFDWTLRSYARYVDDIRLVITSESGIDSRLVSKQVSTWMNEQLSLCTRAQHINPQKTVVNVLTKGTKGVQVSPAMEAIQSQASGPMDVETCEHILRELDGLFPLAEQAAWDRAGKVSSKAADMLVPSGQELGLDVEQEINSQILDLFITDLDVKPETVERFAANRWRKTFRSLRKFTDGAYDSDNEFPSLLALDQRAALFAKRLLRRWIQDPSLVALLRVSLDVYPDPDHLNLVLALLEPNLTSRNRSVRLTCIYVAAELLRAGATETGFVAEEADLPRSADINGYRTALAEFGQRCLALSPRAPWYLQQQALLYLATQRIAVANSELEPSPEEWMLKSYRKLHRALETKATVDITDVNLAHLIIAHHITGDTELLAAKARSALSAIDPKQAAKFADRLFLEDRQLGEEIWRQVNSAEHSLWPSLAKLRPRFSTIAESDLHDGESYALTDILQRGTKIFSQENAALVLLHRLCTLKGSPKRLTPDRIILRSRNWRKLSDPRSYLDKEMLLVRCAAPKRGNSIHPGIFSNAPFRMQIGKILRAAIVDDIDYTTSQKRAVPRIIKPYKGIRTSWYKRQYGMSHTGDSLIGPHAPVSPWIGELLMALLRWPGVQPAQRFIADWSVAETAETLLPVLEGRLGSQSSLYGTASDLPIYITDAYANDSATNVLTLVMVQTVLPRFVDFTSVDPQLNNHPYRAKHSQHLASVTRIVEEKLKSRRTFDRRTKADIIVFPELSVHPSDLGILERLVDKTGAIIFCGLVFHEHSDSKSLVNEGIWLVPDFRPDGRSINKYLQGKHHLTAPELSLGVRPSRSFQRIIRGLSGDGKTLWRVSGAICFDATDLKLAADLRDKTDAFIVPALNKDIPTFDHMVESLHYHMYQHFILVNSGEFGGSAAQAPYRERHEKQIVHCHGLDQAAISICEIDLTHFNSDASAASAITVPSISQSRFKSPPAGFNRMREVF